MKPEEVEAVRENFQEKEWQPIGTTVPNLAGEYFIVTGSGKYFRNVILKPEDSICMIELDEKGENYRIVWGLVNGGRPTSELPSHLMNLEVKETAESGKYRVVYHAHTTNIIALTFVLHWRIAYSRENSGRWQRNVRWYSRQVSAWCRGWFRAAGRSRLQPAS